jgi:microcystin-dependent protein
MSSVNTRWDYVNAKPPSAGGTFREVATYNQLNCDNLTVYSNTHTDTIVVEGLAELSGPTVLRSTLSVIGATTLNTLTVNSWSILSGPVVARSTLSVREGAAVGSLYVVSNTTMVGSVDCLSNLSVAGQINVQGGISSGGDITTVSRFATAIGYVDPEIGDLKMNVSPMERNGWILCNGQQLNRGMYSELFGLIGTTFGNGDGVNTFNVPNADGRVLGNVGGGRGNGESVGSETTTLAASNLPEHTHSGTTASDGAHTHGINDPGHTHTQTTINDDFNNSGTNPPGFTADSAGVRTWNNISSSTTGITIQSGGAHTHTFTTNGGNGLTGSAFSVMQPTLFVGYTFIFSGVPTPGL